MYYGQIVGPEQYVYWQNIVGEDVLCPCACGVGFIPYNHTNLDLARAPFLCHLCYFDVNNFVKITCMETDTQQSDFHINIVSCHIQMLNWIVLGPQGLAPIVHLIDHSNALDNGFYFLYRTNEAEARITKCHTCPELPLSVIRVHENITVHYGHTVSYQKLGVNDSNKARMAHEIFYKDIHCFESYETSYTEYIKDIIDKLILMQDVNNSLYDYGDTALVDIIHASNTTNTYTNPDPDGTTEADLNFCRATLPNDSLPDVNFPDKKWGFIVTEKNFFSFTGPDRPYPVIKCIQDFIDLAQMIRNTGLPNYRLARVPITSGLNIDAWERHLRDYPDTRLIHYLKFGFPLSIKTHCTPPISQVKNHFSAISHSQAVRKYLDKEISMGAILGPFDIDPAHGIHSSPLLTRPKDTNKRRVILNLSHPKGTSLNDQVDRLRFDGVTFNLKFPSIDNITEEILRIGEGVTLAKIDVSRAFRNLRIDPGDALNFGIQWQGRQYLDASAAFSWVHGSGAFQMTSDAIAYLMAKKGYKMFPYIDDYMLVTHKDQANDAFQYLIHLLTELGLPINPDKLCPPSDSLTCLGITIDVKNHTLSIEDAKIKAIWQECIFILNKTYLSRNKFQSLLGKLLYIHKCVKPARIFVNRMLTLFRSHYNHNRIPLNPDFFKDLIWFIRFIPAFNGATYFNKKLPSPSNHVFIDASLTGLGAYWDGRAYATPVHSILGFELGIVQLEMFNILLALRCWADSWTHQSILIHCDNKAVVQVIQSGKSRDGFLSICLRNIWLFMAAFDIDLHITHIQGRKNVIADTLSRLFSQNHIKGDLAQYIHRNCVFESIPLHYFHLNLSL